MIIISFQQEIIAQKIENIFTHYTPKDGLTDGHIQSISQDKNGFLWLASTNGLCRFDGKQFKNYRHISGDTTSLIENRLNQVFIDSNNNIWLISPHWLYLFHRDGEWFEHFTPYNQFQNELLQNISLEKNGELIITGLMRGLYKFNIAEKKFSIYFLDGLTNRGYDDTDFYQTISDNGYYNILFDKEGIEWICKLHELISYNPKTNQYTSYQKQLNKYLDNTNVFQTNLILLSDSEIVFHTSYNGLLILNKYTNQFHTYSPDIQKDFQRSKTIFHSLYKLNDSILLMGTDEGIFSFNFRSKIFSNIRHEQTNPMSISEKNSGSISFFLDREGILWVGGVHLDRHDFNNLDIKIIPKDSINTNNKCLNFLYDSRCYEQDKIILSGYFLETVNIKTGELEKINSDQISGYIDHITTDDSNNVWITQFNKFYSFKIKNNKITNLRKYSLPDSTGKIFGLTFGENNDLYIATSKSGLVIYNLLTNKFITFNSYTPPGLTLTNNFANSLCIDHTGCLWVGTQNGINRFNKNFTSLKQYNEKSSSAKTIQGWHLSNIKEDHFGNIWFSTHEHGIGRINPENDSVTMISIQQGLPTCWYNDICFDEDNNLWATSFVGVVRINLITLQSQLYTESEGFPIPDDINDILYDKFSRKIYILTIFGIYEIDPASNKTDIQIPEIKITGLSVFDKEIPVPVNDEINLKYNENFINIQFAALLFHSNDQIKYAYKLSGIDTGWVFCNNLRNASYTNLPPGSYNFKVKALNPNGTWSEKYATFRINISPPYWKTWWFYLMESIFITGIIYWIIRLYISRKLTKQIMELEKAQAISMERNRIASDMHDELGSGLTSIRLLSQIVQRKTGIDTPARQEIEKIERNSAYLSENLREIIWTMNSQNNTLNNFIIYTRVYAVQFFDDSDIHFQFHTIFDIPELSMSGDLRRNLFLCIKEALHNILKHSKATEASINFTISGNILITEISDNGIGIPDNKENFYGMGMKTMKERLRKFDSELLIINKNGTTLKFKVLIG